MTRCGDAKMESPNRPVALWRQLHHSTICNRSKFFKRYRRTSLVEVNMKSVVLIQTSKLDKELVDFLIEPRTTRATVKSPIIELMCIDNDRMKIQRSLMRFFEK